jgi:hypothetical protein
LDKTLELLNLFIGQRFAFPLIVVLGQGLSISVQFFGCWGYGLNCPLRRTMRKNLDRLHPKRRRRFDRLVKPSRNRPVSAKQRHQTARFLASRQRLTAFISMFPFGQSSVTLPTAISQMGSNGTPPRPCHQAGDEAVILSREAFAADRQINCGNEERQ